jgi:Uma2 family endonuclease
MANPAPKRMTVEEYFAWAETQPERPRFELYCGEVYAMPPERNRHARAKRDAMVELMRAVRVAGVDCEVFPDGTTVVVDDANAFEPDVVVHCGGNGDPERVYVDRPLIVVEVLSPSSKSLDAATKYRGYFSIPSIRHYLILDPIQKSATHHFRRGERIESAIVDGGPLTLDPPGIVVEVGAFFAAV